MPASDLSYRLCFNLNCTYTVCGLVISFSKMLIKNNWFSRTEILIVCGCLLVRVMRPSVMVVPTVVTWIDPRLAHNRSVFNVSLIYKFSLVVQCIIATEAEMLSTWNADVSLSCVLESRTYSSIRFYYCDLWILCRMVFLIHSFLYRDTFSCNWVRMFKWSIVTIAFF